MSTATPTPTRTPHGDLPPADGHGTANRVGSGLFDPPQLLKSLPDALRKLHPRVMVRSPVMFVVLVGSVVTTVLALTDPTDWLGWALTARPCLTTVFPNTPPPLPEGRGTAQVHTLRKAKTSNITPRDNVPDEDRSLHEAPRITSSQYYGA